MNLAEYASYDALGLAELVRRREVSASELRDVSMRAIEAVNAEINAVVATIPGEANAAISRLRMSAPFVGVPFLIKDIGISYAGILSEGGSRILSGTRPARDCELASRFKEAGFVTIGRTNTPEFGNNASTEPLANGPTRNPWCTDRSAGGSSGGAAAAVAAGVTPIAHASDGGGSIRAPAANCGVFGLKPSRGRNPTGPDQDEILFGFVADHGVSKSVRDSAALLDATAGADLGARLLLRPSPGTYLAAAQADPKPLRIAFASRPVRGAQEADADCRGMIEDVAKLCEDLGHELREDCPRVDLEEVVHVFAVVSAVSIKKAVDDVKRLTSRNPSRYMLEATTLRALEYAESLSAVDLMNALEVLNRICRSLGEFFTSCDVWLSPVLATAPPFLGHLDANDERLSSAEWTHKIIMACPFTSMFNQSGQPAMSIPLYWSAAGLPIGSHFVARLGDEDTLFSLAGQLERARPWGARRPNVHIASR